MWHSSLKKKSGTDGRGNVTNVALYISVYIAFYRYTFQWRLDDHDVSPSFNYIIVIFNPFSEIVTLRAIRRVYYNNPQLKCDETLMNTLFINTMISNNKILKYNIYRAYSFIYRYLGNT